MLTSLSLSSSSATANYSKPSVQLVMPNSETSSSLSPASSSGHASVKKIINIPPSMTIFNLKGLSSKLKSDNEETNMLRHQVIDTNLKQSVSLAASNDANLFLPYHYSEIEQLYVCNLCQCNYDSLRSIKAHLWKHSGHHNLSYPTSLIESPTAKYLSFNSSSENESTKARQKSEIHNSNSNSSDLSHSTLNDSLSSSSSFSSASPPPPSQPLTAQPNQQQLQQSQQIQQQQKQQSSLSADTLASNTSSKNGRICSVLLEVIEKLHEEEEESVRLNKISSESSKQLKRTVSSKSKHIKDLLNYRDNEKIVDSTYDVLKRKSKSRKATLAAAVAAEATTTTTTTIKAIVASQPQPSKKQKATYVQAEEKFDSNSECKIETCVVDSIYDDMASMLRPNETSFIDINDARCVKLVKALANNDSNGNEEYLCNLCSYVCYHLPSLKSHMWSHVTSQKFDYSINTAIINAALDFENKLNRHLGTMSSKIELNHLLAQVSNNTFEQSKPWTDLDYAYALFESIGYFQTQRQLQNYACCSPMVSFRCRQCTFETIDLSALRLHKLQH